MHRLNAILSPLFSRKNALKEAFLLWWLLHLDGGTVEISHTLGLNVDEIIGLVFVQNNLGRVTSFSLLLFLLFFYFARLQSLVVLILLLFDASAKEDTDKCGND